MLLLKYPWNTLSARGVLDSLAIYDWRDASGESNKDVRTTGGWGHTARRGTVCEGSCPVVLPVGGWELCQHGSPGWVGELQAPLCCLQGIFPISWKAVCLFHCVYSTVASGAEIRKQTGFPKFLERHGFHWQIPFPLPGLLKQEGLSIKSNTKCSALLRTCLLCFYHLLAKW